MGGIKVEKTTPTDRFAPLYNARPMTHAFNARSVLQAATHPRSKRQPPDAITCKPVSRASSTEASPFTPERSPSRPMSVCTTRFTPPIGSVARSRSRQSRHRSATARLHTSCCASRPTPPDRIPNARRHRAARRVARSPVCRSPRVPRRVIAPRQHRRSSASRRRIESSANRRQRCSRDRFDRRCTRIGRQTLRRG